MADRPRKEPRLVAGTDGMSDSIAFEREERSGKATKGRTRLRWLWVVLALFGFTAAAIAAGWFALGALTKRQEEGTARIYAPEGPIKVRPQQPGGMAVPDRDRTVYGRMDGTPPPPVERLLPGAEQPLPRPQSGAAPQVPPAPAQPLRAAPPTFRDEMPPVARSAVEPSAPRVPSATAAPATTAPAVAAPQAQAVPPPGSAATAAAPTAPSPAAPVAAPGGRYMVQLAAVRDQQVIEAETRRLQRAHGDLLGNLTPTVVRADLGDKGVYFRLRMGPLADDAAAKALCAELEKRNAPCLVVRP
jgi:hypothetical protein